MKKSSKKLTLNRETLRQLETLELSPVNGRGIVISYDYCPPFYSFLSHCPPPTN